MTGCTRSLRSLESRTVAGVLLAVLALGLVACGDPATISGFEPVEALVAVQVIGEDVARVASRQLPAGTAFSLLAVVRARRGEEEIYFTDAAALDIDGARIEADLLRRWPEDRRGRVRWFTIEGAPPYSDWQERGRLPRYQPVFRPEWGAGWTVSGDVRPRNGYLAFGLERLGPTAFGTARYHVRVEVYASGSNLTPLGRYSSPSLLDDEASVDPAAPSVTLTLPGALAAASRVFGLPQVEGVADDRRPEFESMAEAGLLFSRARVLHGVMTEAGREWEDLDWTPIDLAAPEGGASRWGDDVRTGDILRAGPRVVFAFRDATEIDAVDASHAEDEPIELEPGVVDYSDWCLDYSRGAAVRRLGDVFAGGGEVDWGRIAER